jgi:N-acyl-D-amino-acid deacylase
MRIARTQALRIDRGPASIYHRRDMIKYETIIRNALIFDGRGGEGFIGDLGIKGDSIEAVGDAPGSGRQEIDAEGLALCPGLIDSHTHDDLAVLDTRLLPKISQGITTVIVGNCGISAAPFEAKGALPDPFGLLGKPEQFSFPDFFSYRRAIESLGAPVNVAAFVGHSALRARAMPRLDRPASSAQVLSMRETLARALDQGALGLSTGLAYASALASTTEEVIGVGAALGDGLGIYATHIRNEFEHVDAALEEAFIIAKDSKAPLVISHLKCAGASNWGKSEAMLARVKRAAGEQPGSSPSATTAIRTPPARRSWTRPWSAPTSRFA